MCIDDALQCEIMDILIVAREDKKNDYQSLKISQIVKYKAYESLRGVDPRTSLEAVTSD